MATVLVVDDLAPAREQLRAELTRAGLVVVEARDGEEAWQIVKDEALDLVVTDLHMPRCNGIELVQRIRMRSDLPVIVMTGHGTVERASLAFEAGADEFLHAPRIDDRLVAMIREAAHGTAPRRADDAIARRLVGSSQPMERLRRKVAGLAPLGTPVLVSGAPGVGKRAVVHALHELGSSAGQPLVEVDARCFELPDLRSRASTQRPPLHVHHIEASSEAAQSHWARELRGAETTAYREATRVFFSTGDLPALRAAIAAGRFDGELARQLMRFHLAVPNLRSRSEDLPAVAQSIVGRIGIAIGRPRARLAPAALRHLRGAPCATNLTRLERLLERAVAFSDRPTIEREDLEQLQAEESPAVDDLRAQHRSREHAALIEALEATGGNITATADRLGKSRPTIYRMIERHRISLRRPGKASTGE